MDELTVSGTLPEESCQQAPVMDESTVSGTLPGVFMSAGSADFCSRLLSWMSRPFLELFRGSRDSRLRRFMHQAPFIDESTVSGTIRGIRVSGSADFRTGAILLGLQPVMSSYSRKSLHPAVFHLVSVGIVLLSLPDRRFSEGDSHDGGLLKAS